MNYIRKNCVPSVCIVFTLVILSSCLLNLVRGVRLDGYVLYVFQLFGYLVLMQLARIPLNRINFKSYMHYFVVEMLTYYIAMLVFAYFGKWFGFNASNLIWTTVIFFAIGVYVHRYFYNIRKAEADEINKLLENQMQK